MDMQKYQEEIRADIDACFEVLQCQPILFAGSGLSLRYFSAPNWLGLLERLVSGCPLIDKPFAYFRQKYVHPKDIGEELIQHYLEWGWGDGRPSFPETLFASDVPASDFLKWAAADIIQKATPASLDAIDQCHQEEIELLKCLSPHAIITTNYDTFLEQVFHDYEPVVGETILRASYASIGEVLKIHGCVKQPSSIVLTHSDYGSFVEKRKYLSAKLLTYFAEHPLLFVGYGANDPNITHILSDIDKILSAEGELIPNIYVLEWRETLDGLTSLPREHVVDVGVGRSVRVKAIFASDFSWVFKAFCSDVTIQKVNVKLLRALMARTCEIVRHDIPRRTLQVDYQALEHVLERSDNLTHVLGIQTVANASLINADFPHTLTGIGQQLGYNTWHKANQLLDQVRTAHGVDLKASDNRYHIAIKAGTAITHKYSPLLVDLLRKVSKGEPYTLQ